jgi:predicted hotdog family 3-hydroxylacyl-ACP dehydratase
MLFVDSLVEVGEDYAVSRTVFSEDNILGENGWIQEVILFEMMAQTFAAWVACRTEKNKDISPTSGYLTGLKNVVFYQYPSALEEVEIRVADFVLVEEFCVFYGEALRDKELLAEGRLTVYLKGAVGAFYT